MKIIVFAALSLFAFHGAFSQDYCVNYTFAFPMNARSMMSEKERSRSNARFQKYLKRNRKCKDHQIMDIVAYPHENKIDTLMSINLANRKIARLYSTDRKTKKRKPED